MELQRRFRAEGGWEEYWLQAAKTELFGLLPRKGSRISSESVPKTCEYTESFNEALCSACDDVDVNLKENTIDLIPDTWTLNLADTGSPAYGWCWNAQCDAIRASYSVNEKGMLSIKMTFRGIRNDGNKEFDC